MTSIRTRLLALEKNVPDSGPNPFEQMLYQMEKQGEFMEQCARFDAGLESERPVHPSVADGGWPEIKFTGRHTWGLAETMRRLDPPT